MKLLNSCLQSILLDKQKQPALMTHVVLGFPTLRDSMDIVRAMANSGAALIELQIPFSDPMADGPTIMSANEAALSGGTTPLRCLHAMEELSSELSVPLLFMSYFNILFAYQFSNNSSSSNPGGVEQFCKDAANAGAQGLIVPDVPPEENSEGYWTISRQHGLIPIPLVSPVSSEKRLAKIAETSSEGFVYCVSTTGTTGSRAELPAELPEYLARVRKHFSLPLAVGFGISQPSHVQALAPHAEIAVVGSAMIELIRRTAGENRLKEVSRFTAMLAHK